MPIPAAAANPNVKRDHLITNEARYRHYNQEFVNADNSTIGAVAPVERPYGPQFAVNFVAETKRCTGRLPMTPAG
jgi:hypothetical protein